MIKSSGISTRIKHVFSRPDERLTYPDTYLPQSKPVTPTFSYTITESDMPTYTPPLYSVTWVAYAYISIKNEDAADQVINVEIYRNGSPFFTGNKSVPSGQNGSWHPYVFDVSVGDVIDFYAWSPVTNSLFRQTGLRLCPTRICPQPDKLLLNLVLSNWFDQAFANSARYKMYNAYHVDIEPMYFSSQDNWDPVTYSSWWSSKDSYIIRLAHGDALNLNNTIQYNNGVVAVYYNASAMVGQIEYDVLIDNKGD